MGIIIRNIDNKYYLEDTWDTPFNVNPFTKPEEIQNVKMQMRVGELKDLGGLEVDKEYPELDYSRDFEIIERVPQVMHENGLVYDDLTYKLKTMNTIFDDAMNDFYKQNNMEKAIKVLEEKVTECNNMEEWFTEELSKRQHQMADQSEVQKLSLGLRNTIDTRKECQEAIDHLNKLYGGI